MAAYATLLPISSRIWLRLDYTRDIWLEIWTTEIEWTFYICAESQELVNN